MPTPKRGSTLRAQWLGQLLRKERELAGVTNKEAGEYLQRDGSAVSRMEAGITPARVTDVWALMNLYNVGAHMRPAFEQLSREIWYKGWWEGYADTVAESFIDHAWLEARAERIRWFEPVSIPGLFQIEDYARELIIAADPDEPAEKIDRWVSYRLGRQEVLTREDPPQVTAVLDESVLHRRIGGAAVMRRQLAHLLELSEYPNIELRVLDFESGAHASPDGAFLVVHLPDPFPPVAYSHSAGGGAYVEAEQVDTLAARFERLFGAALEPTASVRLIKRIMRAM